MRAARGERRGERRISYYFRETWKMDSRLYTPSSDRERVETGIGGNITFKAREGTDREKKDSGSGEGRDW